MVLVVLFVGLAIQAWRGHSEFAEGMRYVRSFPPLTHSMTVSALRIWPFDKRFRWEILSSAVRAMGKEHVLRSAYAWAISAWPNQKAVRAYGGRWKGY